MEDGGDEECIKAVNFFQVFQICPALSGFRRLFRKEEEEEEEEEAEEGKNDDDDGLGVTRSIQGSDESSSEPLQCSPDGS